MLSSIKKEQRILTGNSQKGQLEKISTCLLQKRQIKITEKHSVTYQNESVGEDEKKTSQVKVQVGTMSLENNFQKKKAENTSVLWPRYYPFRGITLRPQKACKKTMLINVMAKIVQWLLHPRDHSKSFLCSHCIILITHLPLRKHHTSQMRTPRHRGLWTATVAYLAVVAPQTQVI